MKPKATRSCAATACGIVLVAASAWLGALPAPAQESVPAERPRARPPSALTGRAQWEKGAEMLGRIQVPPAPPLAPAEAMQTFRLAPGYRLELVASEPMVQNPIFFEFDPEGRIWVVELQGYMRDLQGSGEAEPICRVVVLEDTDEDGRADKSTVFLDGLVMPRSLSFVKGGVLLLEPPKVWFCEDTDGDLRSDRRTEVGTMGVAGNPQHTANGLRYGIDNWLHSADWPRRHRWVDGKLVEEAVPLRGQFGVTFDETGRFLSCRESSALNADLIPAEYVLRNRHLGQALSRGRGGAGVVDVRLATGDAHVVYPIRVTPAITLGAMELRDDGRLRTYTIVAGSGFYDGDQFPEDARGNVFVPEAGGHLIGRLKLTPGIRPKAERYYPPEQEFLASTDERFRPVNSRVGPDGALYLADMYKGVIEHVIFMVPWIGDQVRDRKLETGNDMGRIYRVVAEDRPIDRRHPNLTRAGTAELVGNLARANGWWRLTSQRLLVERAEPDAPRLLKEMVRNAPEPLARLHALWTLDGLGALDFATTFAALDDGDERVRAAAFRLSERGLTAEQTRALRPKLEQALAERSEVVRLQATLTASSLSASLQPDILPVLLESAGSQNDPLFGIGALVGLQGRELDAVRILASPQKPPGDGTQRHRLLALAARCVLEAGQKSDVSALLDVLDKVSETESWQRDALLEAIAAFAGGGRRGSPLVVERQPAAIERFARSGDDALRQAAYRLRELFTWPGAGALIVSDADIPPLSPVQQKRIEAGRDAYALYCASCHQSHGGGLNNLAPPLAGSEWVSGPPETVVRIMLHGLYGPVEVSGQTWNLNMPGMGGSGLMDDETLASVASYIRRAWGNTGSLVEPELVAAVRQESAGRTLPWTAVELTASADTGASVGGNSVAPLLPLPSGEILLPASKAVVYAQRLAYRPALDILAPWTVQEDIAEWQVEVSMDGVYDVWVNLAADDESAGDFFVVETEGSRTRGEVPSTGSYEHFKEQPAGSITLRAGLNRILMRPDGPLKRELADVRGLRLRPRS